MFKAAMHKQTNSLLANMAPRLIFSDSRQMNRFWKQSKIISIRIDRLTSVHTTMASDPGKKDNNHFIVTSTVSRSDMPQQQQSIKPTYLWQQNIDVDINVILTDKDESYSSCNISHLFIHNLNAGKPGEVLLNWPLDL